MPAPTATAPLPIGDIPPAKRTTIDWPALGLATILALGFSSTFLAGPLLHRFQAKPTAETGEILGAGLSVPLRATVIVRGIGREVTTTVQPNTAKLTEVLAKAAAMNNTTMTYQTAGNAIHLNEFFRHSGAQSGYWTIVLNGTAVVDLNEPIIHQGDTITAVWTWLQP